MRTGLRGAKGRPAAGGGKGGRRQRGGCGLVPGGGGRTPGHIFGPWILPHASAASPSASRAKRSLMQRQARAGLAERKRDGRAGAKAEGADAGWRLAPHKGAAETALSFARAAATGGEHGAMPLPCQQSPVLAGSATLAALGALVLYLAKPSGYGKYSESLLPTATRLPARAAWFLQELPSFAVPAGFLARQPRSLFGQPATVLLGLFCAHYFHR